MVRDSQRSARDRCTGRVIVLVSRVAGDRYWFDAWGDRSESTDAPPSGVDVISRSFRHQDDGSAAWSSLDRRYGH